MTNFEKLQALAQNEDAFKAVFTEDANETLANLAAHGIEMSKAELEELSVGLLEGMGLTEPNGELSETELEDVAGGGMVSNVCKSLSKVGKAFSLGRQDTKNRSCSGISYVESAKTIEGKGWRGIGYTLGYVLS